MEASCSEYGINTPLGCLYFDLLELRHGCLAPTRPEPASSQSRFFVILGAYGSVIKLSMHLRLQLYVKYDPHYQSMVNRLLWMFIFLFIGA